MDVRKYAALVVLGFFLLLPLNAWAEVAEGDEAEPMDTMLEMDLEELTGLEVISATGIAKPINLAPAIASVITAEGIERMGATTLDEVLETVPGLHVYPSNMSTMDSEYSIRGIHTSVNPQVLLLVNNLPITFAYTSSRPNHFRMPVANISRVEVVRGPGSAVHGADAFAGTINVITKDGTEIDGTKAGVRYGSFETSDVWLQHGRQYKGWDVAISLEYQESDGDNNRVIESDLQTTLDGMFDTSASHAPGKLDIDYELFDGHLSLAKENWTLRTWANLQPEGIQGAGVTNTLTPDSHSETNFFHTDLTYQNKKILKDVDLSLRLSHLYLKTETELELFPDGAMVLVGDDGNLFTGTNVALFTDGVLGNPTQIEKQTAVDLAFLYGGVNQHLLRFGTGYKYIEAEFEARKNFGPGVLDNPPAFSTVDGTLTEVTGTANIFMENQNRETWFVSIQDEWGFYRNWEFTAGVRYDHYSDFGETINPRAALVWETRYDLTSKLIYGKAFRAPSFLELYNKNNPSNTGNPDLEPESIETLELAFDYQPTHRLKFIASVFAYEIEDLIELVTPTGETVATSQNSKDQEGRGFELEMDWLPIKVLRIRSNFAYQRSEDKDTGEVVPDAPEVQFYANAHWQFLPQWSLDGQYYWIGQRHRASGDTREDIKDNDIVNVTLRRKNIAKNWAAALAVRNVFDEDVREPSQSPIPNDYPMESRAVWGEIRYTF